jgi:phage/plasmid-like protein (TIGR03299 family)
MAHELEMIGGQAQMAYVGETPWHGLGVRVSNDLTPEQMMKAAGLDWKVIKADTYAQHIDSEGNVNMVPTGRQALLRDSDGKVLTEVGKGWNPVQNEEAFKFFDEFVRAGQMEMHTAGSLKDGQVIWAMADLKDGFTVFGNDQVDGYLLFSNPHKYGASVNVRFCLNRVVCNNTLTAALNERNGRAVRINHRTKFDADKVKEILGISHNKVELFKQQAEFLGSKRYVKADIETFFGEVLGRSESENRSLSRSAEQAVEVLHTQPGAEIREGTFWQLFNAVTYLCDHKLSRSADTRLTSAWFGPNANRKEKALEVALEMAKVA